VALEHSRNVVTILLYQHLIEGLGARRVRDRLEAFNVTGMRPSWKIPSADVTVALGSVGITPLEMAAAYAPFANQGVALQPIAARDVMDAEYRPVRRFRPAEKTLLAPETAFQMVHMLRSAVLRGTGKPVSRYFDECRQREPRRLIPEMGGKTGTTNDCTDAWFTGFTPELIVVVYMGFDTPRSLGPQMTGSYLCAPTWCRIVDRILQTRQTWQKSFTDPPGIEFADVDPYTGEALARAADSDENVLRHVPFKRGTVPR